MEAPDFVGFFLSTLHEKARIVDVACGRGEDSRAFFNAGFSVIAFDEFAGNVMTAQELVPEAHVFPGTIKTVTFPFRTIDGVWLHRALKDIPRQELPAAISKCFDWLKPKGTLFFSVLAGEGEKVMREQTISGEKVTYQTYYQPEQLNHILITLEFEPLNAWFTQELGKKWINVLAKKVRN
jgi:2-polyprenyl-3-methyl-5-hydroxy-6-metoxy-1,4-benzoquinol methylase